MTLSLVLFRFIMEIEAWNHIEMLRTEMVEYRIW